MGVGNRLCGDDAAGPLLIDDIDGRIDALCLDTGISPENFVERAARAAPAAVLIVDATDFGGEVGEMREIPVADLDGGRLSTHAPSLTLVCQYLCARIPVQVTVLGIQPGVTDFGSGVTPPVAQAVATLARALSRAFPKAGV